MHIDYRGKGLGIKMPRAIITDLATGRRLTPVAMADDQTGDVVLYDVRDGKWQIDPATKRVRQIHVKARIKIELLGMY